MTPNAPSGGLSLFPNTSATKPPSRRTTPKPRTSQDRGSQLDMSPSRAGRRTPEPLSEFIIDGSPQAGNNSHLPPSNPYYESEAGPSVSRPIPISEVPPRTDTALSGASTLVRSSSNRSRSSIAKRPLDDGSYPPPPPEASGIRSMFPQYDHSRAFNEQNYFPTQTSPRHIPRTVISRQSHFPPEVSEAQSPQQQQQQQPYQQQQQQMRSPVRSPVVVVRSPLSAGSANQRWPRWQPQEPPAIPPVSQTSELRDYWKAANGWKATGSEGRTYCLKLAAERDAPIYTLSSAASQPLYHLRIDPTSASARVTLSRHDPGKTCKDRDPQAAASRSPGILGALREAESHNTNNNNNNSSSSSRNNSGTSVISSSNSSSHHHNSHKPWQEVLSTTLEAPSRRLPPAGDGLVALLYPSAAARAALARPGDAAAVAAAERECARLVWDGDSANYFLAHPALAAPFCVTAERNAAWSRAEYALEHVESPRHLARLTREAAGAGGGFLEVDTHVAARVEGSYYILDVAVAALLLVAHLDEQRNGGGGGSGSGGGAAGLLLGGAVAEQFAPPPVEMLQPPLPAHLREDGGNGNGGGAERASMGSRISGFLHGKNANKGDAKAKAKNKKNKRRRGKPTDEFEMDLESQSSNSLGPKFYNSSKERDGETKLPGTTRTVIKLLSISFKCVIWALTLIFKALYKVVVGLSKCLTSEKL